MGGGAKQYDIFGELGFEFGDGSGTEAGLQDTGTDALAGEADAIEDQVVLFCVLALILDCVDVVKIEVREAGIDLIMSMIEFDRAEFGSGWNDTVDLGNFCRFSRLRISTTQAPDKAVCIGHVADELHGVIQALSGGYPR